MEINNFELFPREFKTWEFYFVQILERAKDNPDKSWLNGGNSCRVLKSYSISSQAELTKRIPIIKEYCIKYKAICYIHPARRNEKSIAYEMVIMLWEFLKKSNHNLSRLYDSACGHNTWVERLRIIDIDTKDNKVYHNILKKIEDWSVDIGNKVRIYTLPTVNRVHIISTPFDSRIIEEYWLDIHKNNPTLLYCNL